MQKIATICLNRLKFSWEFDGASEATRSSEKRTNFLQDKAVIYILLRSTFFFWLYIFMKASVKRTTVFPNLLKLVEAVSKPTKIFS